MPKILIVDDDEATLALVRVHLMGAYEIIETNNPEQAIGLALEHKPDAILLHLLMPRFAGFELCQSIHSLTYTSRIPIFVMGGETGAKFRYYYDKLGARAYFQEPLDFAQLRAALDNEIKRKQPERRVDTRLSLRIVLELRGTDLSGERFRVRAATENVSAGGFLCQCSSPLWEGAIVEVFLEGEEGRYAGLAQVVRREFSGTAIPWYGFRFKEVTSDWVLRRN